MVPGRVFMKTVQETRISKIYATMKAVNYFKESYTELVQKVSWPSWSQLQNQAIVVMVASLIFAIVVLLMDLSFEYIMKGIYGLLY